MRTIAASIALAVIVACGSGSTDEEPRRQARPAPPPPPSPATKAECAAAARGGLADPGTVPDRSLHEHVVADRADAIEGDCNRDHWPAPVARCLAELGDALDFGRCSGLPPDAEGKLSADLQRITKFWLVPR